METGVRAAELIKNYMKVLSSALAPWKWGLVPSAPHFKPLVAFHDKGNAVELFIFNIISRDTLKSCSVEWSLSWLTSS